MSEILQISLADLEDALTPNNVGTHDLWSGRSFDDTQTTAADNYRIPGTFVTKEAIAIFAKKVLDMSCKISGQGGHTNVLQNFLSRLDRHCTTLTPINTLNYGYTFITRPRLNCSRGNLRQHPVMSTMYSMDANSVPFMIRALLDTKMCNGEPNFKGSNSTYAGVDSETSEFSTLVQSSGLVDALNPFLVPLCNGLKGISGFPDLNIEVETTEGDFHSGDFTYVKGSDLNNRTSELTLEFRDVQGSVILSILYYWCLTMALQAKGVLMPYPDDIYEQRLNYTVAIYRFVTDVSRKHILWWNKATGCFPKTAPVGAIFNINQGEVTLSSAQNFSIPFVANHCRPNDPGILFDFNRLMQRYTGGYISDSSIFTDLDITAEENFNALPYIESTPTGLQLKWKTSQIYEDNTEVEQTSLSDTVQKALQLKEQEMQSLAGASDTSSDYQMPVPDENGVLV